MQTDTLMTVIPTKVPWMISAIIGAVASQTKQSFVLPRIRTILQHAQEQLSGDGSVGGQSEYLAGGEHLTAADMVNLYSVESALTRYPELQSEFPRVEKWRQDVLNQPALQKALEKVGQQGIVATLKSYIVSIGAFLA